MVCLFFLLLPLIIAAQNNEEPRRTVVVQSGAGATTRGAGHVLRVGALSSAYQPFTSLKSECVDVNSSEECSGNKRFEGFCVDLLDRIREHLPGHPSYEIHASQQNLTGVRQQGDASFDGLIGQAQRREVDLICAPMVANEERARAMEFSRPFMRSGLSIMMRKQRDSCFSTFFHPFTPWMWLLILLTFLLLMLARFLLLLLKKKLRNSHPTRQTHNNHGHQTEQGLAHSHALRETSTEEHEFYHQNDSKINLVKNIRRLLKYLLWTFATLVVLYYFANQIANFVSRRTHQQSTQNIDNLISRSDIRYGVVRNGATHQFLQQSTNPVHQQFLRNIESQSGFVANYSEGIKRVRDSDGDYAFLLETTANDYANRQDCTTFKAGGDLTSVDYALGMPIGSPWRTQINAALQALEQSGELENIRSKWWDAAGECPSMEESHRLGWSDLCFLFLLLPLILLLGLLSLLARHFMNRKPQGKRGPAPVNKRNKHSKDHQRLHSPVVTVKNESTITDHGHFNENYAPEHAHQQPHVINHPIRVEERGFVSRRE